MKNNRTIQFALMLLLTCAFTSQLYAQNKYVDRAGYLKFEASEELFEPVEATNESVTAVLNADTGEFASLALVVGFRFANSLMEEHFNENYIESETYPKAVFKGTLIDFDLSRLTDDPTEMMIDGKLALHGKEKEVKTTVSLQKVNGAIVMKGGFTVTPSDFAIEIPSIVRNKIAREVLVSLNFNLKP